MNDPRGPLRTILEVLPLAHEESDSLIGDYTPIRLDCGHVAKMNWIFHYKVGASTRCFQCGQEEAAA